MRCRHCGADVSLPFIDLDTAPPSNSYLTAAQLAAPETWYPLRVLVCTNCWLVQTEDYAQPVSLFNDDYAYFSSYSSSWLRHAESYVAAVVDRFGLGSASHVVEVASNDGYLLQYVSRRGIPCLGIEPTASTACAARNIGIEVVQDFFGVSLAESLVVAGRSADLTVANNVLAHVPGIDDFVAGFARILKPRGVATFEFPHLLRLVQETQFDTIYHEHFSYLSLTALKPIFESNGLSLFDVEEIPTHGGSLRLYAQRSDHGSYTVTGAVSAMLERERIAGILQVDYYRNFQARADRIKDDFVEFLIQAKRANKRVGAYGAAAKGNTLLNYSGVRSDLLGWVVDRNPAKQGKYLPGSRIPVVGEDFLKRARPDYVLVLPWNLRAEIIEQLAYIRAWGGQFVFALPSLELQ
jgi:SAM-dependent methyltransferase